MLQKMIALVILACCFGGCATKKTLVVTVGGLGFSQLGDLRRTVERQFPDAKVVNAGGLDGYKADLVKIATAKPREHIIFVGHSFGCGAIAEAAGKLPHVDLLVFIDPAWNDFRLPQNVSYYLWYRRSGIGIEREAKIIGASAPKVIHGGHNDIPHSDELIAGVVYAIKSVENQKGGPKDQKPTPDRTLVSGSREGAVGY